LEELEFENLDLLAASSNADPGLAVSFKAAQGEKQKRLDDQQKATFLQ